MATTIVQTPSSPDQEGTTPVLSGEAPLCRDYLQEDWGYAAGHHALAEPPHGDIGVWQGTLPLTSCYEYDTTLTGTVWPNYGTAPADTTWHPSVNHDSPGFGPYGSVWPASPSESLSNHPWSPSDQPLPSPLSDLGGPSYFFLARNPLGEDSLHAGQAIAPIIANQDVAASLHNSPATTTINSTIPTPVLKPKDKSHKKAAPASKRSAAEATPNPPRPRTLKRHKSDAPSVTSISTDRTSASTSTTATTTTTLGGVLPANVDPRVASEQIKREAWERCKAEAFEMSQRRMMLLNHEHGALEREAERLQVNLGLMREAVARDQAAGLEDEAAADRAGMWVAGSG